MVLVDAVRFRGKISDFFWNRLEAKLMAQSIAPASSHNSNKTNH